MRRSDDRILTTHVGRLERPDELTAGMEERVAGRPTNDRFSSRLHESIIDIARQQHTCGLDVINDGEFGKLSWGAYQNGRLGGHELVPIAADETPPMRGQDWIEFEDFYRELDSRGTSRYYRSPGNPTPPGMRWACTGPVTYIGGNELGQDLDNLRAAATAVGAEEMFITATSPIRPHTNRYYASDDEYFEAVGEAMRTEYRAIVDAGFLLQIDDPHLPDLWNNGTGLTLESYRASAQRSVEILNSSLRGLPEDRIRYHICWGSWHGPHAYDLPLKDLIDLLLTVNAQGYAIEAANARHEHEWMLWGDVRLPEGKILIPGVVSHATDIVEHPELVAWRIRNFASVVGKENVIASTDCGLGYRVHPQVGWAKLKSLVEGARLASVELW